MEQDACKKISMAMIQRFEDIQTWQEARTLMKLIYQLTNKENFPRIME